MDRIEDLYHYYRGLEEHNRHEANINLIINKQKKGTKQ